MPFLRLLVVTASRDNTARLWDAVTGAQVAVLRGHTSVLESARFSPDGSRIVTASADWTARLWDAATGAQFAVLEGHQGGVLSAAFSSDGLHIVTASNDDTARLWRIFSSAQVLIDHAKEKVPRCLTLAQRRQFHLSAGPPAWCIDMDKWPYESDDWRSWLAGTRAGGNPALPD